MGDTHTREGASASAGRAAAFCTPTVGQAPCWACKAELTEGPRGPPDEKTAISFSQVSQLGGAARSLRWQERQPAAPLCLHSFAHHPADHRPGTKASPRLHPRNHTPTPLPYPHSRLFTGSNSQAPTAQDQARMTGQAPQKAAG